MGVPGATTIEPRRVVAPTEARADVQPTLAHQPALDGLRGLAVAAVVLFHLQRLDGGFLGVDLFFVLSGYLITSLLLVEQQSRGAISLRRFWARRARRLLPALFTVLVGIAVLLLLFTPADQRPRFRGDALATLGYVANWHRLAIDIGYWDIFSQPSPLDHTWSLAIEEQFYVVWPLLVLLAVGLTRRTGRTTERTRVVGWVALVGAATSFVLMALRYSSLDTSRAYFGTDTRIGATLLGAAFAGLVAHPGPGRSRPRLRTSAGTASLALEAAGVLGLAWLAWSVVTVSGLEAWYYRGGLATFAVAAVAVIAAVTRPGAGGLLQRAISWTPLTALGTISYGVYLWHWPINVYVTPARATVDGWPLDLLRILLTLVAAWASYALIEQPIRRGTWLAGRSLRFVAVGGATATVAAVFVATAGTRAPTVDEDRGFGPLPVEGSENPYLLYPREIGDGDLRVLLVGDSGAHNLGPRLAEASESQDMAVASSAPYYCNVMAPEGIQRLPDGTTMDRSTCHVRRLDLWSTFVDRFDPDVVVYYLANAGSPAKVLLDGEWVYDCDPAFDQYLDRALRDEADLLAANGALVVFATSPYSRIPDPGANVRIDCRNDLYRRVVASRPGLAIADMNSFVQDQDDLAQADMFADMVHLSPAGGRVVSAWLLPELRRLVEEAGPPSPSD